MTETSPRSNWQLGGGGEDGGEGPVPIRRATPAYWAMSRGQRGPGLAPVTTNTALGFFIGHYVGRGGSGGSCYLPQGRKIEGDT